MLPHHGNFLCLTTASRTCIGALHRAGWFATRATLNFHPIHSDLATIIRTAWA
jgi:hypothetical protein